MRLPLLALIALTACSSTPLTLYNPFTGNAAITLDPQGYSERRGMVELAVKGNFDPVLRDILAGGGPDLEAAFDAAAVPLEERPTRRTQLLSNIELYQGNPDALVTQLVLFGG